MSEKEKPEVLTILLWVSLVPLAICLVLVVVIGYNYYQEIHRVPPAKSAPAAVAAAKPPQTLQDSLQQLYASTIIDLDQQIDSTRNNLDTLRNHLDARTAESNQLRNEITSVLKNAGSTPAELEAVRQKIIALQDKVTELRQLNSNVEAENRRLKTLLARMSNLPVPQYDRAPTAAPATLPGKPTAASVAAAEMRLTALYTTDDEKEQETAQAREAEKLTGAFSIRNNGGGAGDIMVVVTQPDGQVLQKSTWESGAFETSEGKKIYSLKLRYDATLGTVQPYVFSLSADRFVKGSYTLQLYQNGVLIGRMVKTLG